MQKFKGFWLLPGHLKGAAPGGGDLVDREHGGMVDLVDRELALFENIASATGESLEQVLIAVFVFLSRSLLKNA